MIAFLREKASSVWPIYALGILLAMIGSMYLSREVEISAQIPVAQTAGAECGAADGVVLSCKALCETAFYGRAVDVCFNAVLSARYPEARD